MHINSISCGQGAPSVYLLDLAYAGVFPADVVIVANTGNENDMLWSTGERTTAEVFFEQVVKPLAGRFGMDAYFVRSNDKDGNPIPDIMTVQKIEDGQIKIDLPLFGSNGGRLMQSCTEKWKKQAVRQQLRRLGAKTAVTNLGLTMDEVHRMKPGELKWETLNWPMLLIQKTYRATCEDKLKAAGIPWLVRTQCDQCPHKDIFRWRMSSSQTIDKAAAFEATFGGDFFLTEYRIPLKEVLSRQDPPSLFDMCDQGYCGT